ncbi:hypothetical protein CR513_58564, partial [Mucuna pruriens]
MCEFSYQLLKCLDDVEEKYIIKEIHEGVFGTYIGGWTITNKITRVESANKVILTGLRRILKEAKGRWVEELPQAPLFTSQNIE